MKIQILFIKKSFALIPSSTTGSTVLRAKKKTKKKTRNKSKAYRGKKKKKEKTNKQNTVRRKR